MEDVHSGIAEQLISSGSRVWFTPLHFAEWTHAVAQQVFYKKISLAESHRIYRHLEADRAASSWAEVGMLEDVFDLCADLASQHGPRLGIRTLDSLHVASALKLKAEQFWTFDERQGKLAKAVGLKTRD